MEACFQKTTKINLATWSNSSGRTLERSSTSWPNLDRPCPASLGQFRADTPGEAVVVGLVEPAGTGKSEWVELAFGPCGTGVG